MLLNYGFYISGSIFFQFLVLFWVGESVSGGRTSRIRVLMMKIVALVIFLDTVMERDGLGRKVSEEGTWREATTRKF